MSIGKRIESLRGEQSRRIFAERIGIVENTLRNYEQGLSLPNSDVISEICTKLKITPEWLIFGTGTMRADEEKVSPLRRQPNRHANVTLVGADEAEADDAEDEAQHLKTFVRGNTEYTMIGMVAARLSAGQGSLETGGEFEEYFAFQTRFLRRKGNVSRMVLMRVSGDSMEPAFCNNDSVLVDQSKTDRILGGMYAVGVEDMIYLKILDARPGKLILRSLNKDYEPIEIDLHGEQEQPPRLIGRVVWSSREW